MNLYLYAVRFFTFNPLFDYRLSKDFSMMLRFGHIIFFALTLTFISCSKEPKEEPKPQLKFAKVTIADTTVYSKNFITELKLISKHDFIDVTDSLLIIDKKDTANIPNILRQGLYYTFYGCNEARQCYEISMERINYTTLKFQFETLGKAAAFQQGVAELKTNFFIESDSDVDDMTGLTYTSFEYVSQDEDCSLRIRVGQNPNKKLVSKLIRYCHKDKSKELTNENSPSLYLK